MPLDKIILGSSPAYMRECAIPNCRILVNSRCRFFKGSKRIEEKVVPICSPDHGYRYVERFGNQLLESFLRYRKVEV